MRVRTRQSHEREKLLRRIHRHYATITETVRIGHIELPFTRIADPDHVLDQVAQEADLRQRLSGRREPDEHLHLPYWAELWDSALGLAKFLVTLDARTRLASCSVLELGCGMGLSGTAAAACGARVLFADIEAPALLFARLNSLPWASGVRTRRIDWGTERLAETFDLILGADILYERPQWASLDRFWREHLSPGGTVLLAEPGRQTGDLFIDWMGRGSWSFRQFQETVCAHHKIVRIFSLTANW